MCRAMVLWTSAGVTARSTTVMTTTIAEIFTAFERRGRKLSGGSASRRGAHRRQRPALERGLQHDGGSRGRVRAAADRADERSERCRRRHPYEADEAILPRRRVAGLDLGQLAEPLGDVVLRRRIQRRERDERR